MQHVRECQMRSCASFSRREAVGTWGMKSQGAFTSNRRHLQGPGLHECTNSPSDRARRLGRVCVRRSLKVAQITDRSCTVVQIRAWGVGLVLGGGASRVAYHKVYIEHFEPHINITLRELSKSTLVDQTLFVYIRVMHPVRIYSSYM